MFTIVLHFNGRCQGTENQSNVSIRLLVNNSCKHLELVYVCFVTIDAKLFIVGPCLFLCNKLSYQQDEKVKPLIYHNTDSCFRNICIQYYSFANTQLYWIYIYISLNSHTVCQWDIIQYKLQLLLTFITNFIFVSKFQARKQEIEQGQKPSSHVSRVLFDEFIYISQCIINWAIPEVWSGSLVGEAFVHHTWDPGEIPTWLQSAEHISGVPCH